MSRLLCGTHRVEPRTLIIIKEKQMGRPIKSKYFGARKGLAVGGEGVASIALAVTGTLYTTSTTLTVNFTSPQVPGGVAATAQATTNGSGTVTAVTLLTAGSGYTSTPTASVSTSTTGTTATFSVSLTSSVSDVISCTAFIPTVNGGSSAVTGDIQEQVASKKYRVVTAQGTGPCRLVTTSTLTAGQMFIRATDVNNSSYLVRKLTARRAVLVREATTATFAFADGSAAGWSLDAASAGVVLITNR
jgi:hypothetical protein